MPTEFLPSALTVDIRGVMAPESVELEDLPHMPELYCNALQRIMAIQAFAERLGAEELGKWISKAPDFSSMRVIARIASDEANHAYWLYRELEAMGLDYNDAIAMANGTQSSAPTQASLEGPRAVGDEANEWADVTLNAMFLDRAGRFMVTNFSKSSYGPWARVCQRMLHDENLHQGFGLSQLKKLVKNCDDRAKLAGRVTLWYARGLNFFGPPSKHRSVGLKKFGLKRKDNEELRQEYAREVAGIMKELGAEDLINLSHDGYPYA
jgi:1,2-phenylacetyl-CoA epoxidase catalytic subunit